MKVKLLPALGLVFLAVSYAHHNDEEEHFLDAVNDYSNGNLAKVHDLGEDIINNSIDKLLRKVAEKFRQELANKEPYSIPDLPIKEIKDKNVQVYITLTNLKETDASKFVINKLKNNMILLTEEYDILFPTLKIEGNYITNGTVLGKAVKGSGQFTVWMKNLRTWGKAYAKIVRGAIQIKRLNVDYALKAITAKATGLHVEGLTQAQINKLLSNALLKYFTDNEKLVSSTISQTVQMQANVFLKGMTLSQLINWFKHYIHP